MTIKVDDFEITVRDKHIDVLKAENERLQAELAAAKEEITKRDAEDVRYDQAVQNWSITKDNLYKEIVKIQAELARAMENYDLASKSRDNAKRDLATANERIVAWKRMYQMKGDRLAVVGAELAAAIHSRDEWSKSAQELEAKLAIEDKMSDSHVRHNMKLSKKVVDLEKELSAAREAVETVELICKHNMTIYPVMLDNAIRYSAGIPLHRNCVAPTLHEAVRKAAGKDGE